MVWTGLQIYIDIFYYLTNLKKLLIYPIGPSWDLEILLYNRGYIVYDDTCNRTRTRIVDGEKKWRRERGQRDTSEWVRRNTVYSIHQKHLFYNENPLISYLY